MFKKLKVMTFFAAFALVGSVSAQEELKIGGIAPLSGGGTAWGIALQRGVQLAIDEAKAAGLSFLQAIECCVKHDWAWFKAKWFANLGTATKPITAQGPPKPSTGWDWRSSSDGVLNRGRRLGIERLDCCISNDIN